MTRRLGPLSILLAVALIYGPIVGYAFTNVDDAQTIFANPDLTPPTLAGLRHLWTNSVAGLYVPITYTAWWGLAWIGWRDGTMHAWPFHLLSVLLHAACGMLVVQILRRLRCGEMAATIGGLLFVVHPVQLETVAWASGAKDLLAACFSLIAIYLFLREGKSSSACPKSEGVGAVDVDVHARSKHQDAFPAHTSRRAGFGFTAAFYACLALALLSKPAAIVTPFLITIIDCFFFQRSFRCIIHRLWPTLILIVPTVFVARAAQTVWPDVVTPLWTRPLIAGDALAFYIAKLFWPLSLTQAYGRTPMLVLASPSLHWTWLVPALAAALLMALARRRPPILLGASIFVIGLLPVLGFTPFEFQIRSTVADHYLYLPMFGIALMLAAALRWNRSRALGFLVLSGLALLALRCATQRRVWTNGLTLAEHGVAVRPQSPETHGALGEALAGAGQIERAAEEFEFVAAHAPGSRIGQLRLAQTRLALGQFERALPAAAMAVRLTSPSDRDPWPRMLLAEALAGLEQKDEALEQLRLAERIDPGNVDIRQRIDRFTTPSR